MRIKYKFLLSFFCVILFLHSLRLYAENSKVKLQKNEEATNVTQRISQSTISERVLGVVFGLTAIYILVSYKILEFKNDKNKEKLYNLQSKMTDYEKTISKPSYAETMKIVRSTDIFKHFLLLADKPLSQPNDDDWRQLTELVSQQLPLFVHLLLSEKGVNVKGFRLTMLALFSFKPGQMAVLTGCSNSDVSQTRRRLYLKIFNAQGSAVEFDKRIREMFL